MVNIFENYVKYVYNIVYNLCKKWNFEYVKEYINFKEMC